MKDRILSFGMVALFFIILYAIAFLYMGGSNTTASVYDAVYTTLNNIIINKTEGFSINAVETVDTPAVRDEISKLPPSATSFRSMLDNNGLLQDATYTDMPLYQWCIKGACNAPRSGNYVGTEGIDYVLSKGCRWLDIEAYYMSINNDDGSPIYNLYCGGSKTSSDTMPTIYNQSPVLLSTVLFRAIETGFQTADPLFLSIRFRMARNDFSGATQKMTSILRACKESFPSYMMEGTVLPDRPIGDLMKKVVIVMDSSVTDFSVLKEMVNISLPGEGFLKTTESRLNSLLSNNSSDSADTRSITVMQPDLNESGKNIPALGAIRNFGFQVPLLKYYIGSSFKDDPELNELEELFESHQAGIIPLSFI